MSFTSLLKKATNLIGLGSSTTSVDPPALDGEIVYCKNNVCVYPPSARNLNSRAVPGYLTVRCQNDEFVGSTLILTWVPNDSLKGNPRSLENTPVGSLQGTPRISPYRKKTEFSKPTQSGGESHRKSLQDSYGSGEYTATHGKSKFYVKDTSYKEITEKLVIGDDQSMYSQKEKIGSVVERDTNQRLSSSKSISVEMDGDNLVVTTEEIVDENGAFLEGVTPTSEQNTDADSLSLDSPCYESINSIPEVDENDDKCNVPESSHEDAVNIPKKKKVPTATLR